MYNITTLNKISPVGLARLTDKYTITEEIDGTTGIMVRSHDMHEMELPESLLAIARAGAGVNNIPLQKCAEKGIVVFNTPGANANAVKELVIAGMLLSARNIPAAIDWAKTLSTDVGKVIEKGKKQFAGHEIKGKTLGIFGMGAIGILVANSAYDLGMRVIGYNPTIRTKACHNVYPGVEMTDNLDYMLENADYVSLNAPAKEKTKGMVNSEFIGKMKDGAVLLNFSRDKLINDGDLLAALESGKLGEYVADFGTDAIIGKKGVVLIPHLGASTEEAEDNCASIAADEMMDYIENGNIKNSVNFPAVELPVKEGETRITILTKGIENPVDLAVKNMEISVNGAAGGVRGAFGYAIVSTSDSVSEVPEISGVIKSRVL